MTKNVRSGLGMLAIAAALGLIYLVTGAGDDASRGIGVLGSVSLLIALGGLALLALGLFRDQA